MKHVDKKQNERKIQGRYRKERNAQLQKENNSNLELIFVGVLSVLVILLDAIDLI